MSNSKHTPGPLAVQLPFSTAARYPAYIAAAAGNIIADVRQQLGHQEAHANAKRLVACWNACIDVPTELLQSHPAPFSKLRQERDDLLAALCRIVPVLNMTRMIMNSQEARDEAGELVELGRAAIAAATTR